LSPQFNYRSCLHRAVLDNREKIVPILLDIGVDPSLKDMYSMTAYQLAKNKNIRLSIRKYAGSNPDILDWSSLGITPLTEGNEQEQKKISTCTCCRSSQTIP